MKIFIDRGIADMMMFSVNPACDLEQGDEYGIGSTAERAGLLMSDKGAFITGSTVLIDGGATASYYYGPLKPQA